jgi:ankyrin repeat protein
VFDSADGLLAHRVFALNTATAKGDKDMIRLLIKKGADVNAEHIPHGTALQVAATAN